MAHLALLRVAPLLSATSYVTFTFCEDTFVRPLIQTAPSTTEIGLRKHVNRISSRFINDFTGRGLPFIFLSYPLSIGTAVANLNRHGTDRAAFCFYLAGLVFSVLHFPFGPTAMAHLKRVAEDKGVEGDTKADNTASLQAWLRINAMRGSVADVPSWICYFVAFTLAMS